MYNTISARQIQREYKKVLEKANRSKRPIVVFSNNKPQGAIVGLDLLEQIQLDLAVQDALKEYKKGKTKKISTIEELEAEFSDIRKAARHI